MQTNSHNVLEAAGDRLSLRRARHAYSRNIAVSEIVLPYLAYSYVDELGETSRVEDA